MQAELEKIQGYVSECDNCDFTTTTMDDVYRFCPLCGHALKTYEDIGGGEKGREV